jgi:hypothetical protein
MKAVLDVCYTISWNEVRTYLAEGARNQRVSRGSSVSILVVSGYGLDNRTIEIRSPAEADDFSCSFFVQTGSGAHPASCTVGPFPGAKARPRRDADHSPPSSVENE